MDKGTIVYIGGFELPDKNAAAHRVVANAKALRELGYEVTLVGLTKENKENQKHYYFEKFKCYDLPYPSSFINWVKYLFNIKEELKIIKAEVPVKVIFYNYPAFKLFPLMKFLKRRKCQIYGDITEWYVPHGFSISTVVKRIDVFLRMKVLHSKMDGLIVISDFLKNYYKTKCKNIINIPPLVDISEAKWQPLKYDSVESIVLTYAGSPGAGNKDKLDIIIESVKEIREKTDINVFLQIVGITENQFISDFNFHQFKSERNNYSFVHFKGRVEHLQALEILKKSDYSIFFREHSLVTQAGFPTKFVEAVSAGTPVITNYSSNLKEYFISYPEIGFGVENLTEEEIFDVLQQSLSLSKAERKNNSEYLKNASIFDFRKYINRFSTLFS